jgi:hypothetical protein
VLAEGQQQQAEGPGSQHNSSSSSSSSSSSCGSRFPQQDLRHLLPPLNVVGGALSDWCVLDAGAVTVHVLTERARRFYALEGLWGGPRGEYIKWLRFEHVSRLETKDTIGRPAHGP